MTTFRPGEDAYNYLWRRQQILGEESGRKVRPAALLFRSSASPAEIYLFPITTQKPAADRPSIEIPASERAGGGLDRQCWLIVDEFNITLETRTYDFVSLVPLGAFSPDFVKRLAVHVAAALREGLVSPVKRS